MRKFYLLFIGLMLFAGCDYNYLEISKTYNLRDRGPAGGWIFYINPNFKTDGWKYLEAAPSDQSNGRTWSSLNGPAYLLPTGKAVGDGKNNTELIIAQSTDSAAQTAKDCRIGGFSDWFLPSKDEVYYMCWELRGYRYNSGAPGSPFQNPEVPNVSTGGIGNFNDAATGYWSSSDDNGSNAFPFMFSNGYVWSYTKTGSTVRVRAIRRF